MHPSTDFPATAAPSPGVLVVLLFHLQKECGSTDLFLELAAEAARRNQRIDFVFTRISHPGIAEKLRALGATLHVLPLPWNTLTFNRSLLDLAEQIRPGFVNFHFCTSLNFAGLFRRLRKRGIRCLFHYHGEIRPVADLKFRHLHLSKLRLLTSFVDRVICVSEANRHFLEHHHIRTPMDVIYNGIEIRNYTRAGVTRNLREDLGIPEDRFVLFFMGSMIHRKGIDVLLRALRIVKHSHQGVALILIGGGDAAEYRALAATLGVAEQVHFLGFLENFPYEAFVAADVYVSASRAESFGLSIAEAQLLGVPVIATAVGGVPEVVADGRTGLLVPTEDPAALADAILRLKVDHRLRRELASNGPDWIRGRFDIRDRVKDFFDLASSEP